MKKTIRKAPSRRVELSTESISAKKQAAGRKGRGVDALTLKGDPDLQKRIDMVVERALSGQQSAHSRDVMSEHRTIRHYTLKVKKVG